MTEKLVVNMPHSALEPGCDRGFLLRLPDELLGAILEELYSPKPSCIVGYALTCKRFYRHMVPMLYRQILAPKDSDRLTQLHVAIQNNPSLTYACRHLSIIPESYVENDFNMLERMLPSFANTTSVTIHNNHEPKFTKSAFHLLQACGLRLSSLQDMCLYSEGFGDMIEIQAVMAALESTVLKKLTLVCAMMFEPTMWQIDDDDDAASDTEDDLGNASVAELVLYKWHGSPWALSRLLRWTENLTSFHLGNLSHPGSYCDLGMMHLMLSNHKDTLVELSLGFLGYGDQLVPNLAHFKALRILSLNYFQTGRCYGEVQVPSRLVTCNLKRFTWDFYSEITPANWGTFGDLEEDWVRDFAVAAASRATPDLEFVISYYPLHPRKKSDGYPWDRISRLNDEFNHQGVVITCNNPPLTRAQWEEWCQSFEGDEDPNYEGLTLFDML